MAKLTLPPPCIHFLSILYREDLYTEDMLKDFASEILDSRELIHYKNDFFPMKNYYSKEMGEESLLKRSFFFSSKKRNRDDLVAIKLLVDKAEEKTAINNKRTINFDPGIICLEQVILATSKPYSHRLYLSQGVYGELTYEFKDNSFKVLPWTYPDYADSEIIKTFNFIRHLNFIN